MSTLLEIYGWSICGGVLLAMGLALLGSQLAALDRAMQALCMGQGAMLGVLLGLGLIQTLLEEAGLWSALPLILAIVSGALTFFLSELLVARRLASSNTYFSSLFALLLSGAYLVSALFPALENHMSQKYFGDLATISRNESFAAIAIGSGLVFILSFFRKRFTQESFERTITGPGVRAQFMRFSSLDLITLIALCFCVQTVGYLFTIACLFIPTAAASRILKAGLNRHLIYCAGLAGVSTGVGFLLSLYSSHLPTVPTIIASMVILGLVSAGLQI